MSCFAGFMFYDENHTKMKARISFLVSFGLAFSAMAGGTVLKAQDMEKKEVPQNLSVFPTGEPNTAYAEFFTGQSYLARLTKDAALNCPVSNVTFEPGCRNNWHSHTGGQLLIAVGGRGYYQEKGKPAQLLLPGDVVEIAPDVVHWHGAAPDSWFSHLAIECNPKANKNTWLDPVTDKEYQAATSASQSLSETAARHYNEWYPGGMAGNMAKTDPELAEIFGNFAFGETSQYGNLDTRSRILVTMAASIAVGSRSAYRNTLEAACANGISAVEIKEVLYHAVPYAGMAKVEEMLPEANRFLLEKGVPLPLPRQSVVTPADRFEKGLAFQKSVFGAEHIDAMYEAAPRDQRHIQEYLSANCFGDYQTRPVFDAKTRELLTFAVLVSLGGCEAQVKGHIAGNLAVGNGKDTLLAVVTQLLPYIGYPRTLNGIACLNQVVPE